MLRTSASTFPNQTGSYAPCRGEGTGQRRFRRLKELVEADRVDTVYVESQDRWGTGDIAELYTLLGVLSDHGTRLMDLRDKVDLTGKDDATEMRVFLGSFKSKKEREDLAYRSMRTRFSISWKRALGQRARTRSATANAAAWRPASWFGFGSRLTGPSDRSSTPTVRAA